MYSSSGATIRGDINLKIEEASFADNLFIGLDVMPPVPVDKKSGTYPKVQISGGQLLKAGATVRSTGGSYGEITRKWTSDNYDTIDRGLEEAIDDGQKEDLARFFPLEVASAKWVLRNVRLDHEQRVAAAIMNTTNFGSAVNSGVAYTEANIATIPFIRDVTDAIERLLDKGVQPTSIVLNSTVFNRVRRATPVLQWVGGAMGIGSEVTAQSLAKSFAEYGIREVLVGRQRIDMAKTGAAASVQPAWGSTYVWVGAVNKGVSSVETVNTGGAGFTLVWNKEGGTFITETYRDDKRRSGMIRVRQNTAEKIVDATAGTLIATQYS